MYEDDLPARAQRIFDRLVYGDQPAGWDVGGEKEIVKKLARDDFVAYRNQRYVTPGTIVIVAGKVQCGAVTAQVKKYFSLSSVIARLRKRRRWSISHRRR